MELIAIAFGGAVGSVLRFCLSTAIQTRLPTNFPLATLSVNAIGSLLIGLLLVIIQQRFQGNEILRGLIIIGLLGGFTTFSTFSLETLQLLQIGFWNKALLNIISSISVCLVAVWAGMAVGRLAT